MKRNLKFEQWHIKYLVKSPLLYYSFLILFVGVFLFASLSLKLDIRESFLASANGNEITVKTDSEITPFDGKIYIYHNRNEKILSESVVNTSFSKGIMRFNISNNQTDLSGDVTIEVTTGKQSLLARIFAKAGKN
jgi:hypothetical protein